MQRSTSRSTSVASSFSGCSRHSSSCSQHSLEWIKLAHMSGRRPMPTVFAVLSTRSIARRPRGRQLPLRRQRQVRCGSCASGPRAGAVGPSQCAHERHDTVAAVRLAAEGPQASPSLLSRPGTCHTEHQDWRLTLPRRELSSIAGCMEHVGWRWGGRQGLVAGAENGNHPVLGCGKAVSGGGA